MWPIRDIVSKAIKYKTRILPYFMSSNFESKSCGRWMLCNKNHTSWVFKHTILTLTPLMGDPLVFFIGGLSDQVVSVVFSVWVIEACFKKIGAIKCKNLQVEQ